MSSLAIVLMAVGVVGLTEFGGLWLCDRYVRTGPDLGVLDQTLSQGHRRRLDLWWRWAPAFTVLSGACVIAGVVIATVSSRTG